MSEKIYIGAIVSERMAALGMNFQKVLEDSFIEEEVLKGILNNELCLSEIDIVDQEFLASVIKCPIEYFSDSAIREKYRLGLDDKNTIKSNTVKAKIQCFMDDFDFINKIYEESLSK